MADTNVPDVTFGANGFIIPSEEDVLAGVQADINVAFGGELNPALETPQGQLASSMAAAIGNKNQTFLYYTQQTDPAYASGRMQDAIGRIYFIERNPAQPTVIEGLCVGASGTNIPTGATVISEDGNIYTCTAGGQIPIGGSISLPFACNTLGPIPAPENTVNRIYQAIPGWDTVTNPADGVLGNDTETRAAFEERRAQSVAQNSKGSLPSIIGAVLNVPGVLDAFATENDTNAPVTIGGYSLAANSLYVAVVGGDPQAIAQAIWTKKMPGCAMNGNTTETVLDQSPGYSPPYPSYQIKFETPAALAIFFSISIINTPLVPANAAQQIQAAIISAFAGGDGGQRARIGSTVLATRFVSAVAALGSWAQIRSLKIGSNNAPTAEFTGSIASTTLTVSAVAAGALAAGQVIDDASGQIQEGTTIIVQNTGTPGGAGTYTVSRSQTVASEDMTGLAVQDDSVTVDIDQAPVTSAANIAVSIS